KAWLLGKTVRSIEEKTGIRILAIIRGNEWLRVTDDTVVQLNDSIIIFGEPETLRKLIGK
ncbi:MAG: hypothetical protein DRZ80_01880, partial [Thermoprotei archaeon]